jgi:Cu+-exporting ATPase
MAITAAVGRTAAFGVLVKSGEALERLARVNAVLLDKTGTVSEGRFAVEEIASDGDDDALLRLAAEAEGSSTHPVAEALRRAAQRRGLRWGERAQRSALPGRGIEAGEGASRLLVGSRSLLRERGVRVAPALEEAGAKLAARGLSLAWVAEGDRARGVIGLADPPRADAREAVARLGTLGQRVVLLSGDHAPAVAIAAARAGIAASEAELTPEAKVTRVAQLREGGDTIAMVGDGINDAAALAAADVGVAMARGSDVTLQAADLVVRSPRLGAVPDAIALSRATLRRIRENLGFALAYNALAIPLAVFGVLQPLHAAIAMSLSSLVVTGNAARLLRWQAPR